VAGVTLVALSGPLGRLGMDLCAPGLILLITVVFTGCTSRDWVDLVD
jgi:hypothetical protein